VAGHVVLNGTADASGVAVTAVVGSVVGCGTTASDGSYSCFVWWWSNEDDGASLPIHASAPSTVELAQTVDVAAVAGSTATAPEIDFTPLGRLKGVVTVASAPAAGVVVGIEGTSVTAVTDGDGAYVLSNAPVGPCTVLAEASGEAPASAQATVTYDTTTTLGALAIP
jgi:hypothetical protein